MNIKGMPRPSSHFSSTLRACTCLKQWSDDACISSQIELLMTGLYRKKCLHRNGAVTCHPTLQQLCRTRYCTSHHSTYLPACTRPRSPPRYVQIAVLLGSQITMFTPKHATPPLKQAECMTGRGMSSSMTIRLLFWGCKALSIRPLMLSKSQPSWRSAELRLEGVDIARSSN